MQISLALTLSNLISLVSSPSVSALGTGGQGQLPQGLVISQTGWPWRKLRAPGRPKEVCPGLSPCPVLPPGLGLMSLPLPLQLWGGPSNHTHDTLQRPCALPAPRSRALQPGVWLDQLPWFPLGGGWEEVPGECAVKECAVWLQKEVEETLTTNVWIEHVRKTAHAEPGGEGAGRRLPCACFCWGIPTLPQTPSSGRAWPLPTEKPQAQLPFPLPRAAASPEEPSGGPAASICWKISTVF